MKSISEYRWQGHHIEISASASPRFLWLDYTYDIFIDNKKADYRLDRSYSLTQSGTRFTMQHEGKNLKGQIISRGFPGMPMVCLSTIIDDTIIGKAELILKNRILLPILLALLPLSLSLF